MATQLAEQANEPDETVVDADNDAGGEPQQRDYEAEAREMGWRPAAEFPGDTAKFVDAKTFIERQEQWAPLIKKERDHWKRQFKELERNMKQFAEFASKAEERSYSRALADLQARHDEAVESGDKAAGRAILKELQDLKPAATIETDEPDPAQLRKEFTEWVEEHDWYVLDDKKRAYADLQANAMGPAAEWEGGQKAWLAEIDRRTTKKFADPKPNPVNGGGNRPSANGGAKTWNDLPQAAKAQADRFVKTIPGFSREKYLKDYDWS